MPRRTYSRYILFLRVSASPCPRVPPSASGIRIALVRTKLNSIWRNGMTGKKLLGATGLAFGAALIAGKALRNRTGYDYQNKVVLITGGSRGLGLVMARELVKFGAKVAICARDEAAMQNAVEDIKSRGGDVLAVPCDVTDRADVDHLIAQVHIACGEIDVLINNAGVIQ